MQIVEKLKLLVASERKITAEIIEHILEIELKKIHLQMGYPTMFSFLTEHIGYSASAAQRRIEASRLLSAAPDVKEDIKLGSLNLSQVALVAQSIRQKQKEMPEVKINTTDKKTLLESIKNQTFEQSQKIISQTLDLEIKAVDKKTVQKDESVRIEATFTKEQMMAFNKVKSLMSHINPNASVGEVFEHLAKYYLKRKDRSVKQMDIKNETTKKSIFSKLGKRSDSTAIQTVTQSVMSHEPTSKQPVTESVMKSNSTSKQSEPTPIFSTTTAPTITLNKRKYMPIKIKRAVWQRDHGICQHLNPSTGKKCGSPYLLEIDHIKRVRNGGSNQLNNLRLLCKAHNLWRG